MFCVSVFLLTIICHRSVVDTKIIIQYNYSLSVNMMRLIDTITIVVTLFIFVNSGLSCERHSQNVANLTIEEISTTHLDDQIRVFFMRAPLLKYDFGDRLADIGAFHSSVGFQSMTTGRIWTFEFDAMIFTDAIFPHLGPNNTITWNTGSEVCYEGNLEKEPLRKLYWTIARLVAVIDGKTYNRLASWIREFSVSPPLYQAMNVFDTSTNPPTLKVQATTCSDFVWNVLEYLKNDLDVKLNAVIAPSTTSFALLWDPSHPYEVVKESRTIFDFYKSLVSAIDDVEHRKFHFGDLLRIALTLELREFYVYLGENNYYRVPLTEKSLPMGVFVYAPPDLFQAEVLTYPYPSSLGIHSDTWAGNVSSV